MNQEFVRDLLVALAQTTLPILVLMGGGQFILNSYNLAQKQREQQLELSTFIRRRQYEALLEIYLIFGEFMALFRRINSGETELGDDSVRVDLLIKCAATESRVDAVILRIASEFTHSNRALLEEMLANLRQSAQIFRERVSRKEKLPFVHSDQVDYVRFKNAFSETAAYLASLIYQRLEPSSVNLEESRKLLTDIFSNRWEKHGIHLE